MKISVDAINEKSPLWVLQLDDMLFRFVTRNGIRYRAGFYPDTYFIENGAYHFFLERVNEDHTSYDPDIFQVVSIIIEEFFKDNTNVMLYICDPSDHRQEYRFRLYRYWFEKYSNKDVFSLNDVSIDMNGTTIYAGLLIKKSNPAYNLILEAFEAFVKLIPYDRSTITK